ncbi:MAG: hypothetical protein IJY84_03395 [Clostridia bacterium]|nr:hypothetical protein [Clostridia bacterium]
MKKKLLALISAVLCLATLFGCSGIPNSGFAGSYWLDVPSLTKAPDGFYERIEYEISTETKTDFASSLYPVNEKLTFTVDQAKSAFVTELIGDGDGYIYKTTLNLSGTYSYIDEENSINFTYTVEGDTTTTETHFKGFEQGFACVKSTQSLVNTLPISAFPTSEKDFTKLIVQTETVYGEKDAVHTVKSDDPATSVLLTNNGVPKTVGDYKKDAYIDNALVPLIFRCFKYDNTLNYTFYSIEISSGELKGSKGSAKLAVETSPDSSTTQTAIKTMTVDCKIDGDSRMDVSFNTFGVTISTVGEYSQEYTTAYYANSIGNDVLDASNRARHYMVKCYRPMIYNACYLVYTLSTVSHVKTI